MMRLWRGRPWWHLREPDADEPAISGEPGEGRRLVTTRRDDRGNALEQVWADPDAAAQWDEKFWQSDRGLS